MPNYFPKGYHQFKFPPVVFKYQNHQSSFLFSEFLTFVYLVGMKYYCMVVLICIFLITNKLILSSLVVCLLVCNVRSRLDHFSFFICKISLYVLNIELLSVISIGNIFSQLVAYLFIFCGFLQYLEVRNSNICLVFSIYAFKPSLKNGFLSHGHKDILLCFYTNVKVLPFFLKSLIHLELIFT